MEIKLKNAVIDYKESFFNPQEADALFIDLRKKIDWKQDKIKMFGKIHNVPRLQAWYGDPDKSYTYSGLRMLPNQWNSLLLDVKDSIEKFSSEKFNSVLANLYRDGNDSNGWHADDEKELGQNPIIASLSLGESRKFKMKHKFDKELTFDLELKHGSLLIMKEETQHYWKHTIAKTKQRKEERINLTYRYIY